MEGWEDAVGDNSSGNIGCVSRVPLALQSGFDLVVWLCLKMLSPI